MKNHRFSHPSARQAGVTLVELLVAMTVGLLVTLVALSTLILGRTGYTAVDSTTQLIDKERFAIDTVSKIILQAGYQDFAAPIPMTRALAVKLGKEPEPDLFGWNNAFYTQLTDLAISESTKIVDGNRPTKCGSINDTSCKNGSDVLVVRFQGGGLTASPDGNMVNCLGTAEPGLETGDLTERSASIFNVARDANTSEPSLYCGYYKHSSGAWVAGQPLIEGVESMQFLFGTDNVTAGAVPGIAGDSIADRWLRADQLKVASNPNAPRENWRRVRAVRVGLVLRGPVGSAQERVTATFAPLGTAYAAAADTGSQLAVAADGRLRRVVNFTVHIRNDLSTR
jgi:type IV pilus assembly protein PilW